MSRFLALSPRAAEYYQRLEEKRGNPRHHMQKIVALSEIYGAEKVQRALEDAWAYPSLQLRIHRQPAGTTGAPHGSARRPAPDPPTGSVGTGPAGSRLVSLSNPGRR